MSKGTLSVHSENILPIIKKWLYSDKDIFLRELVSNACDAISKIKHLKKEDTGAQENYSIDITIDKTKKTLTITDNGIGMTQSEVEKYITQIAFSGAEDFLKNYKSEQVQDQIIGHFGLGFYSAYMVSKTVDIHSQSFNDSPSVLWSCDGSSEYSIDEGSTRPRGTEIVLHIDDDSQEYLEEATIRTILHRYCLYLPFPITLNGNPLNNKAPCWLESPSLLSDKDYLSFYHELYPQDPDPILWIHLNIDYPFHLQGILYFPKLLKRPDVNKSSIRLFCNRVYVSDDTKEILPDYLSILKGTIDSPDIPLNVSRSTLQMDRTVRQLSSHISKKVADKLQILYQTEKDKFLSYWPDIEVIVKLGILQDEKFYEKTKGFLVWKTAENTWITLDEILAKDPEHIFYAEDAHSPFLDLYRDKKIDVLLINPYIDTPLLTFLEKKISKKFQRIDATLDGSLLDPSKEKTLLGPDGKSQGATLAEFIKNALSINDLDVDAKSLATNEIPAFLLQSEEERRFKDYMNLIQEESFSLPEKKSFVVNTNHSLIETIEKTMTSKPELAQKLSRHIYDLTLLSQKNLQPTELTAFIKRTHDLLSSLASSL